jgi:glutathione S-transferase
MRLFHMPGSRSSRSLWALEEAGAGYDLRILTREEKTSPEHAARHPLGRVPVLELDDGRFVFESAAIALTIADAFPDAGLLPPVGDPARPEAYQWTAFAIAELEPAAFGWRRAKREGGDETAAAERYAPIGATLDAVLSERTWILGDRFSAADTLIATMLDGVVSGPLGEPPASLVAYVERAKARPAYQRAEEKGRRRD